MQVREVMTTEVMTVGPDAGLKAAARLMIDNGISGLPVVDDDGTLVGIITEADFLSREARRSHRRYRRLLEAIFGEREPQPAGDTVGDAMTRHPIVVDPDTRVAEAAREMADRGIKRVPVVDEGGKLVGIVSRADIMRLFTRPDAAIATQIRDDVAGRVLLIDPERVSVGVAEGVVRLGGSVPTRSDARLLEELSRRIEGVVRVENDVTYDVDDGSPPERTERLV
jgi:CBS domain-containing protein